MVEASDRQVVAAGTTYYFYVVDTTSGTMPLVNPFTLTLNEVDCATFGASATAIDPPDGTREFAEGRDDWAVHVARGSEGGLGAGAVARPALGRTVAAGAPPTVHVRDRALDVRHHGPAA